MTLGGTPEDLARQLGERGLCRKLLYTGHLNVAERRALPGGRARFSVFVDIVREVLDETGWFPRYAPLDEPIGDLLEARDGELWLHSSGRGGYRRYTPYEPKRVTGIREGVRTYIERICDEDPPCRIDGVPIDWDA